MIKKFNSYQFVSARYDLHFDSFVDKFYGFFLDKRIGIFLEKCFFFIVSLTNFAKFLRQVC
jgi:hypothetical protein